MLILCFCRKKNIFNGDHVSSAVQVSDVNNTHEPQEFLKFVNESGCGIDIIFDSVSQFSVFHCNSCGEMRAQ